MTLRSHVARWATRICALLVFILLNYIVSAVAADRLPSDEEVNGILKLCSIGRVQTFAGEVKGKVDLWRSGAAATGKVSIEDLGALLQTIRPEPSSVEIYRLYTTCIKDNIAQFLAAKSSMTNPDEIIRTVDINKSRGFIEKQIGPPVYVSNDHQNGIVEAGYRWAKLDLQVYYRDAMAVQYILTIRDPSYRPDVRLFTHGADDRSASCLGCKPISFYRCEVKILDRKWVSGHAGLVRAFREGPWFYANDSAKYSVFAEQCTGASLATGDREIYIGYSTYGAPNEGAKRFQRWSDLSDAVYALTYKGMIAAKTVGLIKEARETIYPNTYSVRYLGEGAKALDGLDLLEEWPSSNLMPQD